MSKAIEKFKYSLKSGVLHRNKIKNRVQVFCFHKDIHTELTENKGLLESTLLYEFKGSNEAIDELKIFLEGLLNPYTPRFEEYKAGRIVQNYGETLGIPLNDNVFILLMHCRSDSLLKNSFDDIKDAIKQVLLITNEQELIQGLADGYTLLGTFIDDKKY